MAKVRSSNIEVLRIFCILIIILNHLSLHGGLVFDYPMQPNAVANMFMHFGGKLGVDTFIIISGYFLSTADRFRWDRLVKVFAEATFYGLCFGIFGVFMNDYNFYQVWRITWNVPYAQWYFITDYIVMFCLSPFMNKFMKASSIKEHLGTLIAMTVMFVLFPTFGDADFDSTSLIFFLYLYLLGGFIRRVEEKIPGTSKQWMLTLVGGILFIWLVEYLMLVLFAVTEEPYFYQHSQTIRQMQSVVIVFLSIAAFLGFKRWNLPNYKWINTLASTSLGVYMLHDNYSTRPWMWNNLFHIPDWSDSPALVPYALFVMVAIFAMGCAIDLLRQYGLEKPFMKALEKPLARWETWFNQKTQALADKLS